MLLYTASSVGALEFIWAIIVPKIHISQKKRNSKSFRVDVSFCGLGELTLRAVSI